MIEFKDLSVSIDKKNILDSISLVANNREITAVLGRNGSGKTTLLSSVFKMRASWIHCTDSCSVAIASFKFLLKSHLSNELYPDSI